MSEQIGTILIQYVSNKNELKDPRSLPELTHLPTFVSNKNELKVNRYASL